MNTYQPYTYLIGWSDRDVWYYGVRFAKNCHPSELWVSYFTSSKYVSLFRDKHGEPDIVQIRRIFETAEQAVMWETKVLHRTNAIYEQKWLNRNIAGHWNSTYSTPNPLAGKTYDELYGDKANVWRENIKQGNINWWASNKSVSWRQELSKRSKANPKFTTKGLIPHNKIIDTFEFTCEFCGNHETRRNTATQRKRKTCGSKSCAQKWTHKYRR